jgi:hypothetical protein
MYKRNLVENCHCQEEFNTKIPLLINKLNIELRKIALYGSETWE